jgi:hypothetical protein
MQTETLETAVHCGPATIPWSSSFRLESEAIGQDFQVQVAWPVQAVARGQQLPVVYVLDGNYSFGVAAQAARALQSGPFPMPPTLVVGIGYHFETTAEHGRWPELRVRDFTPGRDPLFDAQPEGPSTVCGGADAFLDFIEADLTPFLARRFPVDASDQTVVGASLGGLLALYALLTRPHLFQRYVAISPAIFWGERCLFELEDALAARAADLPAKLFLAAGSLEEAHDARQRFVSNLYELEARLRARGYPGLEMTLRIFEGENHMSVFPGALTRGLGDVFGGYPEMRDWLRAARV